LAVLAAALLSCTWACSLPPVNDSFADLWTGLSPSHEGHPPARSELEKRLGPAEIRHKALKFIEESTKCSSLPHEDQMRLAVLLAVVRNQTDSNSEHARIVSVVRAGRELTDFFARCLSPAPPYVETTIEALRSGDRGRVCSLEFLPSLSREN
jgi:hypothetical protein